MCRLDFEECTGVLSWTPCTLGRCVAPALPLANWLGVMGITMEPERGRGLAGSWTDLGRILETPAGDVMYAVVGIPPIETENNLKYHLNQI
jgi:hypothetical protein